MDELLAYVAEDDVAKPRDIREHFHHRKVEDRHHARLDNFLDDQRHGDDKFGLNLGEGFEHHARRGDAAQERHVASLAQREDELEHEPVHVGQREHA